jgi:ABC-type Mn2+/Zn2+ transport system ATPase subunit
MMDETVITLKDAVVSYREDVALEGVSLEVRRGEFIGIIGPNGAGKTTLLTVVNGLARLLHGEAWVLGMRVNGRNAIKLRKRIGYVAQVENIDPKLPISVRETVLVGCFGKLGLFHRPARAQYEMVERVLELVGITHLAERPIGHLSGGEYQRAAIARALVQQPEILLLDEPTASLDPPAQRDILGLVQLIHSRHHITTLYVTHDLKTLPAVCQRVVMMKSGRIWREGSPEEVLKEEVLGELYGTPAPTEPDDARSRRSLG